MADALLHASAETPVIDAVTPARAAAGGVLHVAGRGFDAVSGHAASERDCAALSAGNGCDPLRGTCVEILVDGAWTEVADVLGVTPTHVVVRSPITCAEPAVLRVRRRTLSGDAVASPPVAFCHN
ncbi:MAG: hypothetical protein U0802_13490 [Candidatus Binatia bacterium]